MKKGVKKESRGNRLFFISLAVFFILLFLWVYNGTNLNLNFSPSNSNDDLTKTSFDQVGKDLGSTVTDLGNKSTYSQLGGNLKIALSQDPDLSPSVAKYARIFFKVQSNEPMTLSILILLLSYFVIFILLFQGILDLTTFSSLTSFMISFCLGVILSIMGIVKIIMFPLFNLFNSATGMKIVNLCLLLIVSVFIVWIFLKIFKSQKRRLEISRAQESGTQAGAEEKRSKLFRDQVTKVMGSIDDSFSRSTKDEF